MGDILSLLELAKSTVLKAGSRLERVGSKDYSFSEDLPREIKSLADVVLEEEILSSLSETGFEILSEERGLVPGIKVGGYRFIVDPLDGTFNFVRKLGPCAVSIALWEADKPVFGVLFDIVNNALIWGGRDLGAWRNGLEIHVSEIDDISRAALCTGFPVRFDMSADKAWERFRARVLPFAKVRMFGSASMSLACIACGQAESYFEENIMLWDVAAGIAIVEGAGGRVRWGGSGFSGLDVYADNGLLEEAL